MNLKEATLISTLKINKNNKIEDILKKLKFSTMTAYPHDGGIRVLLKIESDMYNENKELIGKIIYLDIANIGLDELDIRLIGGKYEVNFEDIINIEKINDVYKRVYIHAEGLRVKDEKGVIFGLGKFENNKETNKIELEKGGV